MQKKEHFIHTLSISGAIIDAQGNVIHANQHIADLFGYTFEEFHNLNVLKDIAKDSSGTAELPKDDKSWIRTRTQDRHKNGELVDHEVFIVPLINYPEQYGKFFILAVDVDNVKYLEDELAQLNRELEVKVEERTNELLNTEVHSQFTYLLRGLRHNLNTPLGNLKLSWELIKERFLDDQSKLSDADSELLDLMENQINKLLTTSLMISDLLIENRKATNLTQLNLKEYLTYLQPLCEDAFPLISLKIDVADDHFITANHIDLKDIIFQCLKNSQVHGYANKNGRVIFSSKIFQHKLIFSIIDDGNGLSSDMIQEVFKPFSNLKSIGGIGLTLVQQIMIQVFSGDCRIYSPPNSNEAKKGFEVQLIFVQ
jgi:PAS domain S-box-containing protein